jgi:hypothetical protein
MKTNEQKNLWVLIIGAVSFLAYLSYSYITLGSLGFPLDDGWIHQTYARNLAIAGEWAYLPGKTSGGSTSPLWTLLLSLVHLTNTGPFGGTFVISVLLFLLAGVVFQDLAKLIRQSDKPEWFSHIPVFAIFFFLEWHMNWATGSGMEIILYISLILLFFWSLFRDQTPWLPGIFIGLAFWTRPDGVTLLGPLYFILLLRQGSLRDKWKRLWRVTVMLLPFFAGYFLFNKITAGSWWPNTFYAKQTEYASLYDISILKRIWQLAIQPWIGSSIVLIPGLMYFIVTAIKNKNWAVIGMFLWASGYILIYAVRLPVVYQHARYLMPTMPVFFLLGLKGTLQWLDGLNISESKIHPNLIRFGVLSLLGLLLIGFWFLGAKAYAEDTAIIHEEMVETSLWIRDNIPTDEVIAAHDIGALGYFGEHQIIDLAGLISPEVIPFIRDEGQLLLYLQELDIHYLMTLSDWYHDLPLAGKEIYRSDGNAILKAGGQPMAIYEYNWSDE